MSEIGASGSSSDRHLVLTGVRSRSHLVYAASYVRAALESFPARGSESASLNLTVLSTGDTLGRGPDREHRLREFLDAPGVSLRVDDTPGWVRAVPSSAALLCIGAPSVRAFASFVRVHRRRPAIVVVDEGLGSYGSLATRRAAYLREGGTEPRATARALAVWAGARLLPDEHWSLYRHDGVRWRVDERVAREFRARLAGRPPPGRTVVYLTQPWSRLGIMTPSAYAAHLRAVEEAVVAEGLRLRLKPHPWEGQGAYGGFEVIAGSTPAELDRAIVGAHLVIGANSTALLNLSAVHRTPVLRVTTPALSGLDAALAARQRSLLDTFLPPSVTVASLRRALSGGGSTWASTAGS